MAHLTESDIQKLLAQTHSPDAEARAAAVRDLCPCHIKKHIPEVWERMIALADDPDRDVRNQVYHVLGDGSPREYQARIVAAYEKMTQDPDEKLRRKARKLMAQYRSSGKINVL
jgi:HEAT repeat protein